MEMSTDYNNRSAEFPIESFLTELTTWCVVTHNDTTDATMTSAEAVFYDDLISNMAVRIALIVLHVTASLFAIVGNAFVLFVIWVRPALLQEHVVAYI